MPIVTGSEIIGSWDGTMKLILTNSDEHRVTIQKIGVSDLVCFARAMKEQIAKLRHDAEWLEKEMSP